MVITKQDNVTFIDNVAQLLEEFTVDKLNKVKKYQLNLSCVESYIRNLKQEVRADASLVIDFSYGIGKDLDKIQDSIQYSIESEDEQILLIKILESIFDLEDDNWDFTNTEKNIFEVFSIYFSRLLNKTVKCTNISQTEEIIKQNQKSLIVSIIHSLLVIEYFVRKEVLDKDSTTLNYLFDLRETIKILIYQLIK